MSDEGVDDVDKICEVGGDGDEEGGWFCELRRGVDEGVDDEEVKKDICEYGGEASSAGRDVDCSGGVASR